MHLWASGMETPRLCPSRSSRRWGAPCPAHCSRYLLQLAVPGPLFTFTRALDSSGHCSCDLLLTSFFALDPYLPMPCLNSSDVQALSLEVFVALQTVDGWGKGVAITARALEAFTAGNHTKTD